MMEIHLVGTKEHEPFPEPTAPRGSEKRKQQDILMMKEPKYWPHSVLPMKRSTDRSSGSIEFAVWDGKTLYIGPHVSFYDPMSFTDPTTTQHVERPETLVLLEGWTVD